MGSGIFFETANNPWRGHPFNRDNNINEINGDPDSRGDGRDVHTLKHPRITKLQEIYVKKVIDALNDLDNVLWEIANESHAESTEWQYHMIDFIHNYEKIMKKQHPVIMTAQYPDGDNDVLFKSSAEAISPNRIGGFRDNPPVADGRKVIITDTDHLWGIGGDWKWVWKSFLMGMNPIFMDPYMTPDLQDHPTRIEWELIRRSMGHTRYYAEKTNLEKMVPRPDLSSSGYCLAWEGHEYLVYIPRDSEVIVNISKFEEDLTRMVRSSDRIKSR